MLTPDQALKLARLYAAANRIAVSTVGRRALGSNHKVFKRIGQGYGANSRTLAQLETFFRAHWPDNAAWPSDIEPGLPPPRRKRRTPTEAMSSNGIC